MPRAARNRSAASCQAVAAKYPRPVNDRVGQDAERHRPDAADACRPSHPNASPPEAAPSRKTEWNTRSSWRRRPPRSPCPSGPARR
jgi:hypothetical protein